MNEHQPQPRPGPVPGPPYQPGQAVVFGDYEIDEPVVFSIERVDPDGSAYGRRQYLYWVGPLVNMADVDPATGLVPGAPSS